MKIEMKTTLNQVAAEAGVCPTTVTVAFCMHGPDDWSWRVEVLMRKYVDGRPEFSDAYGYASTIADAAKMAIEDIAAHEAKGFQRRSATTGKGDEG